ncbi:hypothetical protein YC2023_029465 [Brassica napus]
MNKHKNIGKKKSSFEIRSVTDMYVMRRSHINYLTGLLTHVTIISCEYLKAKHIFRWHALQISRSRTCSFKKPRPHNTLYETNEVEESICPEPNGATRSGTIHQRS